jgi:hypothetical protein
MILEVWIEDQKWLVTLIKLAHKPVSQLSRTSKEVPLPLWKGLIRLENDNACHYISVPAHEKGYAGAVEKSCSRAL